MDPPVFQHKLLILIWFVMLLTPIRVEAYYRRNAVGWTKFFDAIVVEVPENNDQNEGSLPGVDSVNINDPSGVPASFCHYIGYYYNPPYYNERLRSKASTEYKVD